MKPSRFVVVTGLLAIILGAINPIFLAAKAEIPAPGSNKVAYYVFDSSGPDYYPLTSFTDAANIVVIFEGTLWELADSAHYSTGWMKNVNYRYYSEILRDIRVLQSRGIKVLMNVDDAASWSTSTPFTTYDGKKLDYQQFAAFVKACIDSVHLDGISLDIEHKATATAEYITLLKEIGRYFGPLSSDSTSQMYIAAIYTGGAPGPVIGKSREVTAYMNFIMDMAYFSSNYAARFNQWADSIGASKTMIGVLNDYYDLARAQAAAAWQPAPPPKAGIMVYAANNLKAYTDGVLGALTSLDENQEQTPHELVLMQNYPNPFNPSTIIKYSVGGKRGEAIGGVDVSLIVYDVLGREVAVLVKDRQAPGNYQVAFSASGPGPRGGPETLGPKGRSGAGSGLASGVYFYRLTAGTSVESRKMVLMK